MHNVSPWFVESDWERTCCRKCGGIMKRYHSRWNNSWRRKERSSVMVWSPGNLRSALARAHTHTPNRPAACRGWRGRKGAVGSVHSGSVMPEGRGSFSRPLGQMWVFCICTELFTPDGVFFQNDLQMAATFFGSISERHYEREELWWCGETRLL